MDEDDGDLTLFIFIIVLLAIALAGLGKAIMVTPAEAHEFYSTTCCSGKDCAPVPDGAVIEWPNGYEVKSLGIVESYNSPNVHRSPDGRFHLCIQPLDDGRQYLRCIYAPPRAF